MKIHLIAGLTSLVIGLAACGGSARDEESPAEYSVSARQNYEKGMAKLEEEEWGDAAKFFSFVKARFPYSKFAVLAELRLSDALFGAEAYLEAVDGYKLFIKFHPTHDMVTSGYAAFRIGEAYYKMLPDDWFMVPPSFEKDPSATRDAERELATFIAKYPGSPYIAKGKKMHEACAKLLAAHEWYVAKFYWERDKPMGTVLRLRTLIGEYSGTGYDPEALFLLGQAYIRVKRPGDAKTVLQRLVRDYPNHARAADARSTLTHL